MLALQRKEKAKVRPYCQQSYTETQTRQSGLISGQWLSTPRSDRECGTRRRLDGKYGELMKPGDWCE